MKTVLSALVFALAAATSAQAQVVNINQSKAQAGDITPGDAPGFPVTISQPGHYRLTGNLSIGDANTTAILITSPRVTLDLNGFAIQGPVITSGYGAGLSCTGRAANWHGGVGVMVRLAANTPGPVAVGNGTIAGMGGVGLVSIDDAYTLRHQATAHNLRVAGNGHGGLYGLVDVRDSVAEYNCGTGMYSVVAIRGGTSRYNAGWGISSARLAHSLAHGNGSGDLNATSALP